MLKNVHASLIMAIVFKVPNDSTGPLLQRESIMLQMTHPRKKIQVEKGTLKA